MSFSRPSAPHGAVRRVTLERLALTALLITAIASKVPYLALGYGLDADAPRNIRVAQRWNAEHVYATSRLPGYPVHEFALSILPDPSNPIQSNLLSLGCLLLAAWMVYLMSRERSQALAPYNAITFLFTPLALQVGTEAMDYTLSLTLFLVALHFVISQRPTKAALWLGVATASRLTNALA